MIYTMSTSELYRQISESRKLLRKEKDGSKRLLLANYIINLYKAINDIDGKTKNSHRKKTFWSGKTNSEFIRRMTIYNTSLIKNIILNKDFHKGYIGDILFGVEKELEKIDEVEETDDSLSEEEFLDILSDFMKSIKQQDLLDELIRTQSIYRLNGNNIYNLGSTAYNPITGKIDVFVRGFNYDLSCIQTLAHEFGHCYDLKKLGSDSYKYIMYYYKSLYLEVFSKLFERLFLDYLSKHNIRKEATKQQLYLFERLNHNFLQQAFMITLLDDEVLERHKDLLIPKREIKEELIRQYGETNLCRILEGSNDIRTGQVLNYAYGDILSLLLYDICQREGFDSTEMRGFLNFRTDGFDEQHLYDYEFGPVEYVKLYRKEIERLK